MQCSKISLRYFLIKSREFAFLEKLNGTCIYTELELGGGYLPWAVHKAPVSPSPHKVHFFFDPRLPLCVFDTSGMETAGKCHPLFQLSGLNGECCIEMDSKAESPAAVGWQFQDIGMETGVKGHPFKEGLVGAGNWQRCCLE